MIRPGAASIQKHITGQRVKFHDQHTFQVICARGRVQLNVHACMQVERMLCAQNYIIESRKKASSGGGELLSGPQAISADHPYTHVELVALVGANASNLECKWLSNFYFYLVCIIHTQVRAISVWCLRRYSIAIGRRPKRTDPVVDAKASEIPEIRAKR